MSYERFLLPEEPIVFPIVGDAGNSEAMLRFLPVAVNTDAPGATWRGHYVETQVDFAVQDLRCSAYDYMPIFMWMELLETLQACQQGRGGATDFGGIESGFDMSIAHTSPEPYLLVTGYFPTRADHCLPFSAKAALAGPQCLATQTAFQFAVSPDVLTLPVAQLTAFLQRVESLVGNDPPREGP
jgi:hypothetical protein